MNCCSLIIDTPTMLPATRDRGVWSYILVWDFPDADHAVVCTDASADERESDWVNVSGVSLPWPRYQHTLLTVAETTRSIL